MIGVIERDFVSNRYDIKQIITVGEGDGTNYHFRGDLDVAISQK